MTDTDNFCDSQAPPTQNNEISRYRNSVRLLSNITVSTASCTLISKMLYSWNIISETYATAFLVASSLLLSLDICYRVYRTRGILDIVEREWGPQSLRRICDVLSFREFKVSRSRTRIEAILCRRLPQSLEQDFERLDSVHLKSLIKLLNGSNEELIPIIISKMSYIDDDAAYQLVRELANGNGAARKNADVKRLAIDCLQNLEIRNELKSMKSTLLRANLSTPDCGYYSLRASSKAVEDEDQNLHSQN